MISCSCLSHSDKLRRLPIAEEKGERLDALGKEDLPFLKVSLHRLSDLKPPDGHFRNVAGRIARIQNMAIGEVDRALVGVDLGHAQAAILVHLVRYGYWSAAGHRSAGGRRS